MLDTAKLCSGSTTPIVGKGFEQSEVSQEAFERGYIG